MTHQFRLENKIKMNKILIFFGGLWFYRFSVSVGTVQIHSEGHMESDNSSNGRVNITLYSTQLKKIVKHVILCEEKRKDRQENNQRTIK